MNHKLVFVSFCFVFLLSFVLLKEREGNLFFTKNYYSSKITQHSDQNITPNAIVKNEKLSHLDFEKVKTNTEENKRQLASVFKPVRHIFIEKDENKFIEKGVWLWTPTLQMSDQYINEIIQKAKTEGINIIYLSIDTYLDIYTKEDGIDKEIKKQKFVDILNKFISLANQNDIEVDAEAGWRNWAEDGHRYKPLAILNFVLEYNAQNKNKFRGLQYDIEPYLLDEYKQSEEGKRNVLKNLVALTDQSIEHLSGSKIKFSVVVPEFYDKKDGATPQFEYSDTKDSTFGHLMRILDKRENSSIIVMSYRNFAEGEDGAIEITKNEMRTAKWGGFDTKIIIAQETGDVLPPFITFHNTSKEQLQTETDKILSAFDKHPNFGGFALHYANAYFELE